MADEQNAASAIAELLPPDPKQAKAFWSAAVAYADAEDRLAQGKPAKPGDVPGTGRWYLLDRIREVRPDLNRRVHSGELSAHAAAIEAGIIKKPPPEEAGLERLLVAWAKASLEDRLDFLSFAQEEIEAAYDGELRNDDIPPPPARGKGPRPYRRREGEMGVPEVETLLDRGWSVSALAKEIGVTYRTLSRWRWGQTKPNQAQRERVSQILLEAMTGEGEGA